MSILMPPDDAVTVTSAVEARAEEVAARVPRCAGGERLQFFVEESRDLSPGCHNCNNTLF